ncbi:MAG: PAS domain S-box protein [Spirochaetia bacterium]|nr:PAS domain S-box protein [Spirochaetia bacterium]
MENLAKNKIFQLIQEEIPLAYAIINVKTLEIFECNDQFSKECGLKKEELLGKKCEKILIGFDKSCLPDGKTLKKETEKIVEKANNEQHFVKIKSKSLSDAGMPDHAICFFTDITEIYKTEKTLIKAWHILEQSPVSIVLTNKNAEIEYVNPKFCEVAGYTKDEVIGKHTRTLKSGKYPSDYYQKMWNDILTKGEWQGEFHNKKKNGELFWERASISAIKDKNGNITDFVALKEDITKQKEIEEAIIKAKNMAERANRAKTNFLAVMSHEIRTPMNGMLGMADLLSKTKLDNTQKEYLETIRFSGETLLTVINDILDISKIESGKMRLEKRAVNINQMINETMQLFKPLADSKKIKIKSEISKNMPAYIEADPVRLRQILLNLMNNAVKFTKKGYIKIKVTSKKINNTISQISFSVIDTGIGISKNKLKTIFFSFKQSDESTARKYGGTGLGLAICKKLVEMMDGKINVKSELNSGSEFYFTIKTKITNEIKKDSAKKIILKAEELAQKFPMRILIAEDNAVNQTLLVKMLKHFGYDAVCVADGKEAILKAKKNKYDIILMDIQMPKINGIEASKRIKKTQKDKTLPIIIALTAFATEDHKDKCLKAGMLDFISKPVLLEKVYELLYKWGSFLFSGKI